MENCRSTVILFVLLLACLVGHSQSYQRTIDSLQTELRGTEDEVSQIDLLNEIAYNFRRVSPDSIMLYANEAIDYSQRINYLEGLAYGYKNKGIAHYKAGASADTIVHYYETAIIYAEEVGDYYTQAACYNNIGLIKSFGLAYNEAAEYFLRGVAVFDQHIPEDNRLKALMLGNLGTSYHRSGDNVRGIRYYEEALALAERLGDLSIPSIFVDELARARMEEGDIEGALRDIEALMPLHDEIGDYESKGESLLTLAEVKMKMQRYREAISHTKTAYQLTETYGFPRMQSTALIQMAEGLKAIGELDSAIVKLKQSLEIEGVGLTLAVQASAVKLLADIYAEQGEFEQAHANAVRYGELITQDQNVNKQRISDELEAKYQNERRLREIATLKQEQDEKQYQFYGLIALVLIFSGGLAIMIYAIRQKNQATAALNVKHQALITAEQKLNDKNQELEKYIESNLQLENFAHLASHDLREPMRNIVSFAQLLTRNAKDKLDAKELEYLGFIRKGTRRIEGLVQDLLEYSKVTHSPLRPTDFSVHQLISEVQSDIDRLLRERSGTLHIGELPEMIVADRGRIYQLLQNLFTNALRYRKDDVPPRIEITGREAADHYHFQIKDNGIGIAPEYHEQVFVLFKTLKNKSITNNSGIGLATCKKVVEDHQGKIWVESKVGEGSTFHFTLGIARLPPT